MSGYDGDQIRLYLLGTCMGVLLMQRKILPLHGSAVAINGKVYAFVGNSGAGKSTLASAFLKRGYHLLSDDIVPVTISNNNIPIVTPSYPQQKLWQESITQFGMDSSHLSPIFQRETKYAVPVESSYSYKQMPLAGIFELVITKSDNISLNPITKIQRLSTFIFHTYRNFIIPKLGMLDWHFITSSKIINQIDMFRLERPMSGFTANKLVDCILDSLERRNYND